MRFLPLVGVVLLSLWGCTVVTTTVGEDASSSSDVLQDLPHLDVPFEDSTDLPDDPEDDGLEADVQQDRLELLEELQDSFQMDDSDAAETTPPDLTDSLEDIEETDEVTAPELQDDGQDLTPDTSLQPCESDEDCLGQGRCLLLPVSHRLCMPWCSNGCPQDTQCADDNQENSVCVPPHPGLCRPCMQDSDCRHHQIPWDSFCVDLGSKGSFCLTGCDLSHVCPDGYECKSHSLVDENVEDVCEPLPGAECGCEGWMEGASTHCQVTNTFGSCPGARGCVNQQLTPCDGATPEQEDCDGVDNNCNGTVDDMLPISTCVRDYTDGACLLRRECANGQWQCPFPALQDTCSLEYLDCTWWGDILDTDEDMMPNLCDSDDDGDGFPDSEDCEPLEANIHPGAQEVCDGLDNDCNGAVDDVPGVGDDCTSESPWGYCLGEQQCQSGALACLPLPPSPVHCPSQGEECHFYLNEEDDVDGDGLPWFCDPDADNDGVLNDFDNCPITANTDQRDNDGDKQGDACDEDDDNDLVPDEQDCCPLIHNTDQANHDDDPLCDVCDPDDDNDLILDTDDNCRLIYNPTQEDNDFDTQGDLCDEDDDNDQVPDDVDNCPLDANMLQENIDGDGEGDVCDPDADGDLILNEDDNCPWKANASQADLDLDGIGNACDLDVDGDGVLDVEDNCPTLYNPAQSNLDNDLLGDDCDPDIDGDNDLNSYDNCPRIPNSDQLDSDGDCPPTPYPATVSCGDVCDDDLDNDGILDDGDGSGVEGDAPCTGGATTNCDDNCPSLSNPAQSDQDSDGIGDDCDDDRDGDLIPNEEDNCMKVANPLQENHDTDGLGDACDADDDNDFVFDTLDNCPFHPNPGQEDTDLDGIGDVCDLE